MYNVDYTIVRVLTEAKLIDLKASRRPRRGRKAGTEFRTRSTWPSTTGFRLTATRSEGGV